jgi:general secretion pathway protein D
LVDDGQIIVLGGLISDDVQTNKQAVPGLGDIPVLGLLFRYDTRQRMKTNLMVFLRPVVLRDAPTSAGLTADRYDFIRNMQGAQQIPNQIPLPPMSAPQLPTQLAPLAPGQPAVPPVMQERPAQTPPTQPAEPIPPQ